MAEIRDGLVNLFVNLLPRHGLAAPMAHGVNGSSCWS
jgi:hypothetical protein